MPKTLRGDVLRLAEKYRAAGGDEKLDVCQEAVEIMEAAGLDEEATTELWFDVNAELARERTARERSAAATPWGEQVCERCGGSAVGTICSTFNTEQICDACKAKETRHPDYERARATEEAAVRAGNFNFPGIGKPTDL